MVLFTIISMFIISPKLSVFVIVFIPMYGYVISVGKSKEEVIESTKGTR